MSLPVDLTLRTPGPRWLIADPDAIGVTNAAFVVVRPDPDAPYTPLITVSGGVRPVSDSFDVIADESLAVFAGQTIDASVLKREEHGTGFTQLLGGGAVLPQGALDMRQAQLGVTTAAVDRPDERVVLLFTLTCTVEQLPEVAPEFQAFVATATPGSELAEREGDE